MSTPTAYPLVWPPGWPRTESVRREKGAFRCTLPGALEKLRKELNRLGAKNLVLSSNATLGVNRPPDTGVCAYFHYKDLDYAIPCDRWLTMEANIQAIALTVEAMRGMERWGAKNMLRAMFSGFKALPAPRVGKRPWYEVMEVDGHSSNEAVTLRYRQLLHSWHPDKGGTNEQMVELNAAFAEFKSIRKIS